MKKGTAQYERSRGKGAVLMQHQHRVIERRLVTVTPTLAAKILEKNDMNRLLRQRHIDRLARVMKAGKWRLNGETLKFALDGTLIDGQHRLYAVLMSDVDVEFEFVEGLEKEASATIDTGVPRTMQDVLRLNRMPYASEIAATLKWYAVYEAGLPGSLSIHVSHEELMELLADMPQLHEAVPEAMRYSRAKKLVTPGVWGFVYTNALRVDAEKAHEFAEQLDTGEGLEAGMPVLALRDKMLMRGPTSVRVNRATNCALTIRAWNAFYTGRPARRLLWKAEDGFPQIAGKTD